jgi:tRNA(His) 5'-end guanylyltransferase
VQTATSILDKQTTEQKYALLQVRGIVFDELPGWQRYGAGLYWQSYEKAGFNPRTGQSVSATRRKIHIERDLLTGASYAQFLRNFLV